MTTSNLFSLGWQDVAKGIVMAVLTGVALPLVAIIQAKGFSIATADWHAIVIIGLDGGLAGFASYLIKNFFSDKQGRVLGKVG